MRGASLLRRSTQVFFEIHFVYRIRQLNQDAFKVKCIDPTICHPCYQ